MQIAGDPFALRDGSEMLDFFLSLDQSLVSSIALGKVNIAGADDERESASEHQEPAIEVKRPPGNEGCSLYRQQYLNAIALTVDHKRAASSCKDEKSGCASVVLGEGHAHQHHRCEMEQTLAATNPEQ